MYAIFVDVPAEHAGPAARFWASALGGRVRPVAGEEQFTAIDGAVDGIALDVQAVDDEARYHVDVETDDVAAEVLRLTGLGAVEVSVWEGCHVLRAPGGQLLCVVPVQSAAEVFTASARVWE
ncbi:VOC family protein [Actinosynnema mirum]|uniref:VOC family protein n=1 Tax=Actinosynnema mirum TaxID=40567 RepID=UPI00019AC414|nr:VOC family protein [Actinosynnema mirum]AXX33512.1 hypothetical protein APASM_6147 [Actinosynnema pretiosum subsp. pretiosum]